MYSRSKRLRTMNLSDRLLFGIVFPLMFCLVGGLFFKKGYNQLRTKRDKKARCLSQTRGEIVDIDSMSMKTSSGRRKRCYFPTYEYVVDNEVFRIAYSVGTTHCQFHIGEQVTVWYDKKSPNYSYIAGYKEDIAASIGCLIMGGIAICCGLFVGVFVWFG